MPVSVRHRDNFSRKRGQSPRGLFVLQHIPLLPHQPPGFAMTAHGTAQPKLPSEMGPPVHPLPQGNGNCPDKASAVAETVKCKQP